VRICECVLVVFVEASIAQAALPVVRLQGVPMRELRMLIAEWRTASIRHAHSVEVEAPPGAPGWALGGPPAVGGAAGEDAGNHLWSVPCRCWDATHRDRIPGTPSRQATMSVAHLIGTQTGTTP
jgi:hypothetical protein